MPAAEDPADAAAETATGGIVFRRLSPGTVFRIGYIALLGFILPLCALFGLLALGGADTVTVDGSNVHGVGGLIAAIIIGFVVPAVLAAFMAVGSLVIRLAAKLLPGRKPGSG